MSKMALIFPGQGSQKAGMLSDYMAKYNLVSETFEQANHALGYDLWHIIQNDADQLAKTQYTQPALLASSVAIYRVLLNHSNISPSIMAGHSLGEYSALVCAGSLSFEDGLRLVEARGKLMQDAVPDNIGAMCAIIGLDDDRVNQVCNEAAQGGLVQPANYNSPGQVVISGEKEPVERACELAKSKGAKKVQMLPVSVPSHSALMKPAAVSLEKLLAKTSVQSPQVPVVHNADVSSYEDQANIKQALVEQLYSPVRWVETINSMHQSGIDEIIECGPGKVLSGLGKRIKKAMVYHSTATVSDLEKLLK
jgi:[acyl-carrier-protein] S-malonyltransferase